MSHDDDFLFEDGEPTEFFDGEDPAFDAAEFALNPEPRCPCVLVIDTSEAMAGKPIRELAAALRRFRSALLADSLTAKRVEVAVVGFGPVRVLSDFGSPEGFTPPRLQAAGPAPLGEAVELAVELVDERKDAYRAGGVQYYRPWIFLLTAGAPSDDWENAAELVRAGEARGAFAFHTVAVGEGSGEVVGLLGERDPLRLEGLAFEELFTWLGRSLERVSHSRVGAEVALPEIEGWLAA